MSTQRSRRCAALLAVGSAVAPSQSGCLTVLALGVRVERAQPAAAGDEREATAEAGARPSSSRAADAPR